MKVYGFVFTLIVLAAFPASAQNYKQLGPHQHGHGRMNIAIEGSRVSIDLEVPGDDIIGFEHEPSTPEQMVQFDEGKARLEAPLALFRFPSAAGCRVLDANAGTQPEHEEEGSEPEPGEKDGEHRGHSEFRAVYSLDCESPSALSSIDFHYFETFSRAQALDVAVIAPNGQSAYNVTRANPKLDLSEIK